VTPPVKSSPTKKEVETVNKLVKDDVLNGSSRSNTASAPARKDSEKPKEAKKKPKSKLVVTSSSDDGMKFIVFIVR
jgi:hypothetical protein